MYDAALPPLQIDIAKQCLLNIILDILSILERMKAGLTHCHKSLLHQLSRRLQKFPRFYFLSLEDVLHIVCNGNVTNRSAECIH